MPTKHSLALVVDEEVSDDEGRRMLVDQILSLFPDAIVDGIAKVKRSDGIAIIRQQFRSPMFDRIADNVAAATVEELDLMLEEVAQSPSIKGAGLKIYKQAIEDAKTRIANVWGIL